MQDEKGALVAAAGLFQGLPEPIICGGCPGRFFRTAGDWNAAPVLLSAVELAAEPAAVERLLLRGRTCVANCLICDWL